MTGFDAAFARFLDDYFQLDPVGATGIGDHRFDGMWPDATEAGRLERLAFADRWQRELDGLRDLTADEAIDRDLLLGELDALRFAETELREDAWDPLSWVYLLGGGLFDLIARDFAPLANRLASFAGRLEGIPTLLDGAQAALVGVDGRPVSRFHTETAINQLPGVAELIDDALAEADGAADDPAVAAVAPRLRAAADSARTALTALRGPPARRRPARKRGRGPSRRGPVRAEDAPHDAVRRSDAGADPGRRGTRVRRGPCRDGPAGWRDVDDVVRRSAAPRRRGRARPSGYSTRSPPNIRTATTSWTGAGPRRHGSRRTAPRPTWSAWPTSRWTSAGRRPFCGPSAGRCSRRPVRSTRARPRSSRSPRCPTTGAEEQRESYLREDNDRMLRLLCIHEAIPGHYLQGVYANRCPSLARAIFGSGALRRGLGGLRDPGDDGRRV